MTITPTKRGRPLLDLTGRSFGDYTVLWREGTSRNGAPLWRCRCSCGKEVLCQGGNLASGNSKRCDTCRSRIARHQLPRFQHLHALLREAAAALPPGELRDRIVAALGTEGES